MIFTDIIFQMDFLIEKQSSLNLNLKREQGQAVKELYPGRDSARAKYLQAFQKLKHEEQQDGERCFPCDSATEQYY